MHVADSPDSHGARLTIDLGAIAANWRQLSQLARPAACGASVKADGYGLGIERVVAALAKAGCATFFVAHLSEAAAARKAAPDAVIYVLNGLPPGSAGAYIAHNLRPVIGSRQELADWNASPATNAKPFALHVDTGMNRLGFRPDALPAGATPALIMSHFISSEEPDSPLNARQIAVFEAARRQFPGIPISLANSSAMFLAARPFGDLVRPGYALYGGNPTPDRPNPMRPVVSLAAPVIQVFGIKSGETIGYNAQWTAKRNSRIATVSVGYADGWLRALSATDARPGGEAIIGGMLCPFAGRVSMDLITIDVTDVPEPDCQRGAQATLIGGALTIDRIGARGRSIGYEVLTSLGRRYERVYID